jgi:hypothetical protein
MEILKGRKTMNEGSQKIELINIFIKLLAGLFMNNTNCLVYLRNIIKLIICKSAKERPINHK